MEEESMTTLVLLVEGLALLELDALRFVDTFRFVSALREAGGAAFPMKWDVLA